MAVAVHQGFAGDSGELQPQAAGPGLANQKFLEQERVRADAFGGFVGAQRKQLVAERQQTTGLQTDDGYAAQSERRVSGDQPIELTAGVIDQPRREKGPPAAQWPAAIRGLWHMDAVSVFDQLALRGF